MRSSTVNWARVASSKANQTTTTIAISRPPSSPTAMRTPKGRQVCGSDGASTRPDAGSEPAGMDVGQQDGPRADLVEVVHQLLGAVTRDHGAYGDPALAMQRRHGRPLEARRQRDGLLDAFLGHVVVHHHVGTRHEDSVEPAPEDLEALGVGSPGAGDQ